MAFSWYVRIIGADANNPASYNFVGGTPPSCPGAGNICSVFADNNPATNKPVLDDDLKEEMIDALDSGQDTTRVLLRSAS